MNYTPSQLEAINTIDQNLQIIACAGSGKTQVISQRIINILSKGVVPAKIIAFTYTEKAAGELQARVLKLCREQLPDLVGVADMYIGTIHAWCLKVLQEYKYEFQKYSVLDEIKLKLFVDRNFGWIGMKAMNMTRFRDSQDFISIMSIVREAELKENQAIPEDLQAALNNYEETLRNACYLDFTMIMTEVIKHLQNDAAFISKIQKNIGFLIVDEYQDVNPVQEQIVNELYKLGANICVVGDDDQTIFQWRGSSIEYIQHFQQRYQNVKSVILDDNFRSSKAIVDVALHCITNNSARLPKQMQAKGHQVFDKGDILYNEFASVDEENEFIINSIKNLRGVEFIDKTDHQPRGLDYSDMVILVRKWKKANAIIEALQEANIPFIVSGVNNLFQRTEIIAARFLFLYLNNDTDASILKDTWQTISPKIKPADLENAIAYLDTKNPDKNSYYETFIIQDIFLNFLEKAGIRESSFVAETDEQTNGYNPEEIIFYNLGMFSKIINDFETIYFKTDPKDKLRNFINFLQYTAEGYYPEGWLNNTYRTPNAVQIMTIFGSKGLEFPVVFIPGLNRNYLPTAQPNGYMTSKWNYVDYNIFKGGGRYRYVPTEDERRLMYVAITRSKKFLLISRAPDGRMQGKQSEFAPEIRRSAYIASHPTRDYAERQRTEPTPLSEIGNISLNFSLLKSFFDCPYSFKFYSFYGFCNPLGARMGFGAAIHHALMEVHREYLEENPIDKAQLPALVENHLHFPYATEVIKDSMTIKAKDSVNVYYDRNVTEFPNIEFAEKTIQLDLGDGILVNGQMDLIKKRNLDGTEVKTIIDFKSTDDAQKYNATVDQLQLYALGYKQLTGANADYLEIYNLDSNDNKRFELEIRDLDSMKQKIIDAANDIRANKLDHTCNDPKCVCRFKK